MNALDPLTALVVVYAVMASVMLVLWLLDRWTRNVAIADVGWCIGLVSAVAWYAWSTTGDLERKILLVLMAALYGLRLGLYVLLNRVIGKDEDARYQHLRREWGSNERIILFGYFQLQAAAVALDGIPLAGGAILGGCLHLLTTLAAGLTGLPFLLSHLSRLRENRASRRNAA